MEHGESNMKGIYSRTFTVQDDKLNDAMEICKGLAEVRKVHFPDSQSYFSFQIGGNPRSFRETLIGEMFDGCLLYTSPSPRDRLLSRMPSSA